MKLTKALEILDAEQKIPGSTDFQDHKEALTLGMRAIKRLLNYRRDKCHAANIPLKGET